MDAPYIFTAGELYSENWRSTTGLCCQLSRVVHNSSCCNLYDIVIVIPDDFKYQVALLERPVLLW